MANSIIQGYLSDGSVDMAKRQKVLNALRSGQDETSIQNLITQKYGTKYGNSQSSPATGSREELEAKAAKNIIGGITGLMKPDIGKAASAVTNMATQHEWTPPTEQEVADYDQAHAGEAQAAKERTENIQYLNSQGIVPDTNTTDAELKGFRAAQPSITDQVLESTPFVGPALKQNRIAGAQADVNAGREVETAGHAFERNAGEGASNFAGGLGKNIVNTAMSGGDILSLFNPADTRSQDEKIATLKQHTDDAIAGFKQAVGGGVQGISAPFAAGLKYAPAPVQQGANAVGEGVNQAIGNSTKLLLKQLRPDLDEAYIEENIVKPLQLAFQVGTIVAPEKVMKVGKKVTGIDKIPSVKKMGEKLYESAIKPTAKEAELMQLADAGLMPEPLTRARTALQTKGVTGSQKSIGVRALKEADRLYKEQIGPAVKGSKEVITREELFKPLEDKIKSTIEPGRKAELQKAYNAIKEEYAGIDFDKMDLDTAQQIKRGLDEFTPQKAFKGEEIGGAYNQLRNDMADAIRKLTYDKLKDFNIREKYLHYGNLRNLADIGIKARTMGGLKGGFGNFWSTVWDMAATPVKTTGGRVLYNVGNVLEFVGPKGLKKFSDYLEPLGLDKKAFQALILSDASNSP